MMLSRLLARCAFALVLLTAPALRAGEVALRWSHSPDQPAQAILKVTGLERRILNQLKKSGWEMRQWQKALSVRAQQGDIRADATLPPMLGRYRVEGREVWFEPQFPLAPGVKYQAALDMAQLPGSKSRFFVATEIELMPKASSPSTVVTEIYPTADTLPENLLKFYLHFSAPMSGGHVYDHIHLRDAEGKAVELPFLEIDEELWDPEMRRLTLFIDPGRIKREVLPLEEIGPALVEGKSFVLEIDSAWKDAAGASLRQGFEKKFRVGPPDREPLDPARWQIQPPAAGTREPLRIAFPDPLDHALALRMIHVVTPAGKAVEGTPALGSQERLWSFTPARPWKKGAHQIAAQTILEDLAGNNIGKPFEVDLFEGVQRKLTNSTVKLPFEAR